MDFDRSAIRHSLVVAHWDASQYHVFVRTDDGDIEHYWCTGEGVMFGPERLGGHFDNDPQTVWVRDDAGLRLHLLGRSGIQIVDWSWPSDPPGWLGVPAVVVLPGFCLTDPRAVVNGGLHVFAVGVEGLLRHWQPDEQGWFAPETVSDDLVWSAPVAISRAPGTIDVFAVAGGGVLRHWWNAPDGWHTESRGGSDLIGPPTVTSYAADRLDVFCVRNGGIPVHWGWNGLRWFDAEERLDMTDTPATTVAARPEVELVTSGANRLFLFARSTDGKLVEWTFQTPDRWGGANSFSRSPTPFAAWSSQAEQVDVLSRTSDGGFSHDFFLNDPGAGMGEPVAGMWESEGLDLAEPAPPPVTFTPAPVDPDLLLTRPRDLVLLGLRWDGFEVHIRAGAPAELTAAGQGSLTVILPPQHVAEEVVAGTGPATPTLPASTTGGFQTWRAALSGASRVVIDVGGSPPIPLTVEGVLDALRRGRLRPGNGLLDGATAIEIPYGLVISPHTADNTAIVCAHPADEAVSPSGTVGLWHTRIAADGRPAGEPAGLVAHPVGADSGDPFAVPLSGGNRARILLEQPTARIDRLALSALGGTLSAAGAWPGFTWEHVAVLGRDRRVRVTTQGVLYPFGHRAEFVELTERVFQPTSAGAIAHLRKTTTLRVTEPVRHEPADAGQRAAFPFTEVEIERTFFENLDPPGWTSKPLPTPESESLRAARDQVVSEADQLYEKLYGDMGPGGGTPPTEDLADGRTDGAHEPLEEPEDPDNTEIVTRAQAATSYLEWVAARRHIDAQLAALPFGGVAPLDVFFVPHQNLKPIQFPVRLAGRLGDLHITLPLIFVADIDRPAGLLTPAFQSLTDFGIRQDLTEAYTTHGDGVVDVGGTRIDLVRAAQPKPADICEVRRLHIVGASHGGGFRARLGAAPRADEGDVPAADRWGFEADLPAVRTLLGADQPPLTLALSRALLQSAPDLEVPFQIPDTFPKLATAFAKNTARSGGICAPDIVADGISRTHGPVTVAGLPAQVGDALDPRKVLSEQATLLGFKLSDLIDADALKVPPQILSEPQPGRPPKVTLTWNDVKLATETGPFVTGTDSQLDLTVALGTAQQEVTCTVQNVALALPDRTESAKLLQVSFATIKFTQTGDAAPTLDVTGVKAEFFGVLKLLEDLQKAVDLGDSAPQIDTSSSGVSASYTLPVPDVTAGAFQMTGLVFHAGLDVPFDGRPVSIALAFASREQPFNLSVLMFGGGGYVEVLIDPTGLRRLEIALEFGASLAMNFVVARGEVHVMGGVRLVKEGDVFAWSGYLRFGGSVSIFGLVNVSVEVSVTLTYRDERLTGRATLVLEIDLTLFSESVELDTGEWELIGGSSVRRDVDGPVRFADLGGGPPFPAVGGGGRPQGTRAGDHVPDGWRRYRAGFAKGSV
jgi:hypothetical protein